MRWPEAQILGNKLFGMCEGVELSFERLIVLAFDLELGLEFFDLKVETRNFGAELC